jgi:hypothetical protein
MTENCIGECQTLQKTLVDEEVPMPNTTAKIIIHGVPAYVCSSCSGREMASRVRQELTEFKRLFLANSALLARQGENISVNFQTTFE